MTRNGSNQMYFDEASAENAIVDAALTVSASNQNDCVSPGDVVMRNPTGAAAVLPGTTVSITVSRCEGDGGAEAVTTAAVTRCPSEADDPYIRSVNAARHCGVSSVPGSVQYSTASSTRPARTR